MKHTRLIALAAACMLLTGCVGAPQPPESLPAADTTTTTTTTTAATVAAATVTTTTARAATPHTTAPLLHYDTAGRYVQPAGAAWTLMLVNDWNPIPAGYEQSLSLVSVGNMRQTTDARIASSLRAMLQAGKAYGIDVVSGYRTTALQNTLYWRQVYKQLDRGCSGDEAQRRASTVVKRPGYTEHSCGLAVDLGGSGNFRLETDFERTAAYRWLVAHCAEYGFILRYPKGKEDITGVIYEPWHYRYVGKEAATVIMQEGLCLEEYLARTAAPTTTTTAAPTTTTTTAPPTTTTTTAAPTTTTTTAPPTTVTTATESTAPPTTASESGDPTVTASTETTEPTATP